MSFDRANIDKYAAGGESLGQSIRGLSKQDLLAAPPPGPELGKWTIQQVVIHLMDADLIWTARMKMIIAEENPTILGYDQDKFVANLHCNDQPAEDAVKIFDLNRRLFATVLKKLPDEAFNRTGQHNERGAIKLGESVSLMISHLENHLKFIRAKRAAMGKS